MEIKFRSNISKVNAISSAIRLAISSGEFEDGERLPSINSISKNYAVARDTVFKAFKELKSSGIIQSSSTKGYYVSSSVNNILVILDIFSPFKNDLYRALTQNISKNNNLNLYFHHYNKELFDYLVKKSVGKYNKYLIMNTSNEEYSEVLDLLDKDKVLLLDFGRFAKDDFSYICQGFDVTFYDCLYTVVDKFLKYKRFNLIFPKNSEHPRGGIAYYEKFCSETGLQPGLEERELSSDDIRKGEVYLIISHTDLIEAVKICKSRKYKIGEDIGIVTYNDEPMLEVIEDGISSISIDFRQMGLLAARFINNSEHIKTYLPTKFILRNSL